MCLAIMIVTSCVSANSRSRYFITTQKPADSVAVLNEKALTTFVVVSATGIGSADIALADGAWPGNITIRFTYTDGRGFKMLEGRVVSTDAVTLRDSDLPARYRGGAMGISLPAKLLAGTKRLKVEWIDAYRN